MCYAWILHSRCVLIWVCVWRWLGVLGRFIVARRLNGTTPEEVFVDICFKELAIQRLLAPLDRPDLA